MRCCVYKISLKPENWNYLKLTISIFKYIFIDKVPLGSVNLKPNFNNTVWNNTAVCIY